MQTSLTTHIRFGCIATTKLIWTAVILIGSEASGARPLANGKKKTVKKNKKHLNVQLGAFGDQKGGLSELP